MLFATPITIPLVCMRSHISYIERNEYKHEHFVKNLSFFLIQATCEDYFKR